MEVAEPVETCLDESLAGDEGFEASAVRGGVEGPAWAFGGCCCGVLARVDVLDANRPTVAAEERVLVAGRYALQSRYTHIAYIGWHEQLLLVLPAL